MKISIIVPCYNEENNIGSCLDSLIEQDYDDVFEIFVVDNDSQDGSQKIISRYSQLHSSIKFFIEKKRGTAAARNRGIRHARYEHIAFIDADCVAPLNWLTKLADKALYEAKNSGKNKTIISKISIELARTEEKPEKSKAEKSPG